MPCQSDTVRKYLLELGLVYKKEDQKEPLIETQQEDRLNLCLDWEDFEYFDDVIFTDEAGILLNDKKDRGWFPQDKGWFSAEDSAP